MEFTSTYAGQDPNLKALSSRLRVMGRYLHRAGKGMQPFVYGRDFNPTMKNDEANTLNVASTLGIGILEKMRPVDSIIEHLLFSLKEI